MSLSEGEKTILAKEYDHLSFYLSDNKHFLWSEYKNQIIHFCEANSIRLYNVVDLKQSLALSFVQGLLNLFSESQDKIEELKAKWLNDIRSALSDSKESFKLAHETYLSVDHQYLRTHKVAHNSLLTQKDMMDLFDSLDYKTSQVVSTAPFSLTEISIEHYEKLVEELNKKDNEDKKVFLPVAHDGHWFYLLRDESTWSLQDSQPVKAKLSPRQQLIFAESANFLEALHNGANYGELLFKTSSKQMNNYDCGTQVINSYRKLVNSNYQPKTHEQILEEVFNEQIPGIKFSEILEKEPSKENIKKQENMAEIEKIITTTASAQLLPEKQELYKANLRELISGVISQGLFTKVTQKINLETLDFAEADKKTNESDESFATRVQEAEFRKVGLI